MTTGSVNTAINWQIVVLFFIIIESQTETNLSCSKEAAFKAGLFSGSSGRTWGSVIPVTARDP